MYPILAHYIYIHPLYIRKVVIPSSSISLHISPTSYVLNFFNDLLILLVNYCFLFLKYDSCHVLPPDPPDPRKSTDQIPAIFGDQDPSQKNGICGLKNGGIIHSWDINGILMGYYPRSQHFSYPFMGFHGIIVAFFDGFSSCLGPPYQPSRRFFALAETSLKPVMDP